jgi:hypothetical protein
MLIQSDNEGIKITWKFNFLSKLSFLFFVRLPFEKLISCLKVLLYRFHFDEMMTNWVNDLDNGI